MEPVELDFIYGGNTATEGPKIVKSTEEIAAAHAKAKLDIERHNAAIVELRKDLVGLGADYKQATKSQKSEILADIELTKKNIIDETAAVKQLKAELASLSRVKPSAAMPDTSQIGKAAVGYNSLSFSTQQLVRELPAATMGLNMFFLAISNNIPVLTDGIKRAKAEVADLKTKGLESVPVWKQLASSIFSWQSAMMVGITVLSMYGKDIIAFVSKLFTGKEAIDKTAESQKALNKVFSDFTGNAARKIGDVVKMGVEIETYGKNAENSRGIIDNFNKTFNTHLTTIEQVRAAYPKLSEAAIDAAIKIQAANSLIEKSAQAVLKKQEADTALSPYSANRIKEQETQLNKLMSIAKKYGKDINELTTKLISGEGFGVKGVVSTIGGADFATGKMSNNDVKTLIELKNFYNDGDNLWFAKYLSQQRKYGKLIGIENKEIGKLLAGVEFKDYSPTATPKSKHTTEIEAYKSESDFQKLIYSLTEKSESMLIGLKEDSLSKRLEVIQQEKEKELNAIKEKEIAIIDEYNKSEKKKVNEYNKTHKDKKTPTLLSTNSKDISTSLNVINPTQAALLTTQISNIENAYHEKSIAETDKWQKEMLALGVKYGNEKERVEKEYTERIQKLAQAGFIIQAAELAKEKDEKLSKLESELIKETDLYKLATDSKLRLTKDLNEKLIAEAKAKINADKSLTPEDKKKLLENIDSADVDKANSAIDGLIIQYKKLKKAKQDAANAKLNSDTEGEAKAARDISDATSGIEKYGNEVLNYFDQVSKGVIGIMDQLGMFTEDEKKSAENIVGMVSGAGDLAVGIATGNVTQIISGAISLVSNAVEFFDFKSKEIEKSQKQHLKNVEELEAKYKKLQRAVETALGTDIYKAQRAEIENQKKQISEYEAWLALESQKKRKKQDADKIAETKAKIDELKNSIEDEVKAITESIAQTNVKDLASELSDALVTAFQNGESAAEAMGNVVNNVLRNAVINALKLKILDKLLAPAIDQFANDVESGGELTNTEASKFKKSVTAAGEAYFKALNDANSALGGIFNGDTSSPGIKGDVAKMTEETGSKLTGQINAMRLNVVALLNNSKSSLNTISRVLVTLESINNNTERLNRIDETLYYIKLNGIKVL